MNPELFIFTRIGLGWMSEFMHWFRVDGGKIRVKKLQFRKYPDSYWRVGAWGLSAWLPFYESTKFFSGKVPRLKPSPLAEI